MPMRFFFLALGASLAAGCVSTGQAASNAPAEPPSALTVENLLTWPLEGEAGADKTIAALREVIQVQEKANPGQFHGRGPAQIANGYALSFASFTPANRIITIGIEAEPCFPTEKAAAVTKAVASPVVEDAHGAPVGKTYDAVRNGMRLSFTTAKAPYACVRSIYIEREGQR